MTRELREGFPCQNAFTCHEISKTESAACSTQVHNERMQGGTIPRVPSHCGVAEKSQPCHKYFIQHNTFASEKTQVRTQGRQTCFSQRAPSNLATLLAARQSIFTKPQSPV